MPGNVKQYSRICLAYGYTDLRFGTGSLARVVQGHFSLDPFQKGCLFLFCGRRTDRIKGLLWEGDGFVLVYKRLEAGRFQWPRTASEARKATPEQFTWLMQGPAVILTEPVKKFWAGISCVCYNCGMEKIIYTEGELNNAGRDEVAGTILSLQENIAQMTQNQELILEQIAGCRAHARRKHADALKAIKDEKERKGTLAYDALKQIGAIYKLDNDLPGLTPAQRQHRRQQELKPLVDAYFVWVKKHQGEVLPKSPTGKAFAYSVNQERYLRIFLEDGEVPPDNNAAESTLRGFCIGRHSWKLIDTIRGARSSAIIYSITETAKANDLKVYEYVEHLLAEIPKHEDDTDRDFLEDLLPWSPNLPEQCRKSNKYEVK